ncbi:MAG: ATP-binding protein [Victivallaceae bacterium]|nr:ATP-binding protein [Victivallaceae bacterium]
MSNGEDRQSSFFNMVLELIPCQVFIKDPLDNFRYKIASRNFIDYYQLDEAGVIEHPDEDIFDQEVVQQLRNHDREVCASPGKVFRYDEDVSYHRRGKETFKSLKVCFKTADGHPYMLGVCVDVTDMNNLIRTERINNEALAQAVAESEFARVVAKSSKTLRTELNCSRIIVLSYSSQKRLMLYHDESDENLKPLHEYGLADHEEFWNSILLDRFKNNQMIVYDNLHEATEMREFIDRHSDCHTRSFAAIPVFVGDELLGGLLIYYNTPHVFLNADKELLSAMSKIISLAAIRDRQLRHMRQVEEENQSLLDNISIPLWLYSTTGEIVQTNKAADRIFGRPDRHQEFGCRELLKCENCGSPCPVRQVFASRETARERYLFNGRSYLVESRPILDRDSGAVRGVVSSFYDVSDLDAAISCQQTVNDCLVNLVREMDVDQALEKSIQGICEHLQATRCYIMRMDFDSSTAFCDIEYSKGARLANDRVQKFPRDDMDEWVSYFMSYPLVSFPTRESMLNHPGLNFYRDNIVKNNVQSIYAHRILVNGKLWGYLSALYEQTPHELTPPEKDFIGSIAYCIELMLIRKQYQNKVFASLRQAQMADKAKSMFLACMSHEIRTPLNAVIGLAELLKAGSLPKATESEYIDAISDAGNALLALINDVLDLSKLEAGQMVFTPTGVDFAALIHSVSGIFIQKCQEKKLRMIVDIPPDTPVVCIDKLRVRQILFNLLGNAVKFTDAGSITIKADFQETSDKAGVLRFSVIDTGIGITDEDQKRIFQTFVQAKALRGTQAEHHGTGLGLAICKRMIEQMDGKMTVTSKLGHGSEFRVELYNVPTASSADLARHDVAVEKIAPPGKISVLVADDVTMNRKVMSAILKRLDSRINVFNACNADEAWAIIEREKVDIFFTDLWMPGMNGAELTAKIRHSEKHRRLPVAAVTADVDGGESFDMSVFDAVLTKPITIEKIRNIIGKFESENLRGDGE